MKGLSGPGRVLIMVSYAGFGDLLYLTPLIRFIKRLGCDIDVWSANPEPFLYNPDISELYTFDSTNQLVYPLDFYKKIFNFCQWGQAYISNVHTIDAFTFQALNIHLRPKEKDLVFKWRRTDETRIRKLLYDHKLTPVDSAEGCNYVIVSPIITWPSRTLPLEFYQELIAKIQNDGSKVVLVGKDLNIKGVKGLYPASSFPDVIDFTNQLTFSEAGCLYSLSGISIANESANMVLSCTNTTCFNIYIPTLTPPEFRLPWRCGSQNYRNLVVGNEEDYYPSTDYLNLGNHIDLKTPPVKYPTVSKVFEAYKKAYNFNKRN